MNNTSQDATVNLSEIYDRAKIGHLTSGFNARSDPLLFDGDSLPYSKLSSQEFERLCYLLLQRQSHLPRYFGYPGQDQSGIDLLVYSKDKRAVYQCKNWKKLALHEMKEIVRFFEKKWIHGTDLPRPEEFYLCCPLPLQERALSEKWIEFTDEFRSRTGISVEVWDRNYLDEELKRLPDVVADLFSDQAAREFCELDDWNEDLFRPLKHHSGEPNIERYLKCKESGQLYLAPSLPEKFAAKIETNKSLLINGLPGSGKSITGLALAESLHRYRVFYINMRLSIDEDDLVEGIRRRLTRPTLFLLDDCQGKFDLLNNVRSRLVPILRERPDRGLLLFLSRTTPTPEGMIRGDLSEFSDFEEEMKLSDAIIELRPLEDDFRKIIELTRPDFSYISEKSLKKIYDFTGHDLYLLSQLLEILSSPEDINSLKPETLFEKTLNRYFGRPTVHHPGFTKLASLAQFDLAPAVASFIPDLARENADASEELVIQADRPPRLFFLHSSGAELIFRALTWCNDEDPVRESVRHLTEFFGNRKPNDKRLIADLSNALVNPLKLSSEEENAQLRRDFLGEDAIYSLIENRFEQIPLHRLSLCLRTLKAANTLAFDRYLNLVRQKIDEGVVLKMAVDPEFPPAGLFLRQMKSDYSEMLASLQNQIMTQGMPKLIQETSIQNLLPILVNLSDRDDDWWVSSLDEISDNELDDLIERTIKCGQKISSVGSGLRLLEKNYPELSKVFERKTGGQRYLRLIAEAGTIFELFRIIQHSTLDMAEKLIDALDAETLDRLIKKTIAEQRSIGTLHFTLRELRGSDEGLQLLTRLEEKIGEQGYLRLIAEAGTIFELFRIIRHSTLDMAEKLIDALDAETLDRLIKKTIAEQRSIGTLNLALRELRGSDEGLQLLTRLEEKIGEQRYLRLIAEAGTIFELFRIIQYSTLGMAEKLIDALDEVTLDRLIKKTIDGKQSIGSLHWTLSYLKRTLRKSLTKLETKIGVNRWWMLIQSNGTMNILAQLVQSMTDNFIGKLAEASSNLSLPQWKELILRSDFAEACRFVKTAPRQFLNIFTQELLSQLKPTFEDLINQSTWEALNRGKQLLMEAPPSDIKNLLDDLLSQHLKANEPDLTTLGSFSEAANCVQLLGREFPLKQADLIKSVVSFWKSSDDWHRDENFMRSVRGVFHLMSVNQSVGDDARDALKMSNSSRVADICKSSTSMDVFLYLWNVFGLWLKWREDSTASFAEFLNPEISKAVCDALPDLIKRYENNVERDNAITLAGLLSFFELSEFSYANKDDLRKKLPAFSRLLKEVKNKTFVPGVFFLLGLEWIFDEKGAVEKKFWIDLLPKAFSYSEKTPALDYLIGNVQRRIRGNI